MSKRDDKLLVADISEAIDRIKEYTTGQSFEQFISDNKTVDAVIRNFIIIGEAANNISDSFKENHTEIDWFRIRGFRNRIAHDYIGIDYKIVWAIIQNFLDELANEISSL